MLNYTKIYVNYAKIYKKFALIFFNFAKICNICEIILFSGIGQKHLQYQINFEAYFEWLCVSLISFSLIYLVFNHDSRCGAGSRKRSCV